MIVKKLTFLLFILFVGSGIHAVGQDHFRVIGGIPHLPVVDPAAITSPSAGMMILDINTKTPVVYSGNAWESFCSNNLGGNTDQAFQSYDGIPFLPILSTDPVGATPAGAVYYSTARKRIMIYSGVSWASLSDMLSMSGAIPVTSGFSTSGTLKVSRIPVLSGDIFPNQLSEGAFYFSTVTKSIRYYANGIWQDLNCLPIETIDPSAITNSSFTSGIRIFRDGLSFSRVGICWSTSPNPVNTLPTSLAFQGVIPASGDLPLTVVNNLDASTRYYVRAFAVMQGSGEVIYGKNKELITDVASLPTIITLAEKPGLRTPVSAESGGDITRDGGARITKRGVIFSEMPDPKDDPMPDTTYDGSGVGRFDSKMSPLKANTTYYARAYADNIKGRAYGEPIVTFTTPGPTPPVLSPSIKIEKFTDVWAFTTVTIRNNGGSQVTERGVSWSKVSINQQDWSLNHPDIKHERSQTVSAFDIGTFDCHLINLEPGTFYYVRTYARNEIGTSFSAETTIYTTAFPTVHTLALDENATTGKTATGAGEVISTGASSLLERGFIWSKVPGFDPALETDTMKTVLPLDANENATGLFYGLRENLEPATTYYVCAYAKNSFGTGYGDVLAFSTAAKPTVITDLTFSQVTATSAVGGGNVTNSGGERVIYKGLSWNQHPSDPEPNQYVLGGNDIGPFFSTISGLRANTTYYVRAFGTNSVGAGYGDPVELKTGEPVAATIQTYSISNTSGTSVPAAGNILNDGGSDVRERGFCWNTTGAPTITDSKVSGGTATGRFDLTISGLQPNKTYFVRAYAITDAPLPSYGNVVSFKTLAEPTVFTKLDVTVDGTTAQVAGEILSDGGTKVFTSGIVWGLTMDPKINLPTRIQSGQGTGEFNHTITELLGNSTYYYRAFATNAVGTAYGDNRTLVTPAPKKPTIKTLEITNITGTSARGGGDVISHGGALLVETGLVWSEDPAFVPEDVVNERTRQTDERSFTSLMTGLKPGTKYYVRAFAKNAAGLIAYGDPVNFTTWNFATVETLPIVSKTNISAIGQGRVTHNGGTAVTRNGLVWAEHKEPTIDDFVSWPYGSGTGTFTPTLNNLYGNTTYYVRAYAINSAGVSYGPEEVFFTTNAPVPPTVSTDQPESTSLATALAGGEIISHGGGKVTTRGVVWGRAANFDYRNPEGIFERTGYDEGPFSVEMTGMIPGSTYYVRAFAFNGTHYGYGPEVKFTAADYPQVATRPASAKTNKTITTGGVVASNGHAPLLRTGVVWSLDEHFNPASEQQNRIVQNDQGSFTTTITGLKGGNWYYVYAFAENAAGISYGQKEKIQTLAAGYAEVITTPAAYVNGTSARTGGNITDDGGSTIHTRGVAFSESKDLEPIKIPLANKVMQAGSSTGPFITYLSDLKENTIYYIRAFVVNDVDTTYGNQEIFRTQGRPIVTIEQASSPFATRAGTAVIIDARIVDDGRADMLGYGLVWSKTSNPDISLTTRISYNRGRVGPYQGVIDGLEPATEYFVRAYGINTVGLNYGNAEFHFETPPIAPPVLSLTSVSVASDSTATALAEITDNGGSWVTERGIVWGETAGFDPVAVDPAHRIKAGEDIGSFSGLLSGLKPGKTYFVRAYAINKADIKFSNNEIAYHHPAILPTVITDPLVATLSTSSARGAGTVVDPGGSLIDTTGLVWSTKQNFDPLTDTVWRTTDGALSGGFTGVMTGLSERVTYYVRAYATNGVGTGYGKQESFCLFATAPELTTISIDNILGRTATAYGSLDRDGGMPVTRWGFVWSTDKEPDYFKHPHTENIRGDNDPVFTGNFTGALTNLLPNTQYYIRAYAINLAGVGYGVPVPFLTADYPTLTAAQVHTSGTTTTSIKGNITHNGRLPMLKRGIVWGLYDNPEVNPLGRFEEQVPAGVVVAGHGEGEFVLQATGLEPEKNYYAKMYGVNQVGTTYSTYVRFKTNPITSPTVETVAASNVTPTAADPGGKVTDNGGSNVTLQGIIYHTDGNIDLTFDSGYKTTNNGSAQFTALLSGLEPGTTYYYRAYAYNGYKYGYGEKKRFETPAVPPTVGKVTISDIQPTSVKATSEMTHAGGSTVTARGFVWTSQAIDPTIISNEGFTDDMDGRVGAFLATLSPLQEGKVYRVRAYATNGVDTGYGPVEIFTICPPTITRFHAAGHNGAPVDKQVTYKVESSTASGQVKCWIAQNLGAATQASASNDYSPDAYGWYFQFNRTQGYERSSSGREPNSVWTGVNEAGDWDAAKDPCKMLLGEGWRMPTKTEWETAILTPSAWKGLTGAYGSLKIHAAGNLHKDTGNPDNTTEGKYWSSTSESSTFAYFLNLAATSSSLVSTSKSNALTVRCLQDAVLIAKPSVSHVTILEITDNSAKVSAAVSLDGGQSVTNRGIVWNTTGGNPETDPVTKVPASPLTGIGRFEINMTGLSVDSEYHVWAYATNDKGTVYSKVEIFKPCPPTITRSHYAGFGAPVDADITYKVISSRATGESKCWIGQNLGAARPANAVKDENKAEASGWYWQFNRVQGYQYTNARTPATWVTSISESLDWQVENDPCHVLIGSGWRIPTRSEWEAVKSNAGWTSVSDAYASSLKIHGAGNLYHSSGNLENWGAGKYWSSTQGSNSTAWFLSLVSNLTEVKSSGAYKSYAMSVRCIQQEIVKSKPSIGGLQLMSSGPGAVKGSAIVVNDGGEPVTDRGIVYNTTGAEPVEGDNISTFISAVPATGVGRFDATATGLVEGTTYYVWAYATNTKGTALTLRQSYIVCPPTITRFHFAGHNGAPSTKEVVYNVVSSHLTGEAKCWITQNLGAKDQPVTATDLNTEAFGWYWQFNKTQGYERNGTGRTPGISWPTTVENGNWDPAKDPCRLLLGDGWRLPSKTEWETVMGNFSNLATAFGTNLKLHATGYLDPAGVHKAQSEGLFWSTTGDTDKGYALYLRSPASISILTKLDGFNARCLMDEMRPTLPSVSKVVLSNFTGISTAGTSAVTLDGGSPITGRGFVWNTTGGDPKVDRVTDVPVAVGSGTGEFQLNLAGLVNGTTYYVWAYATNSEGTAYSEVEKFVVCPPSVTGYHVGGHNGAPSDRTIEYGVTGSMLTGSSSCWITRNLGATQPSGTLNDPSEAAAGWYWQFNKPQGYEMASAKRNPTSWGGNNSENSDWKPENDPCNLLLGGGWRLPTRSEWTSIIAAYPTPALAFQSDLNLHYAGYFDYGGTLRDRSATSSGAGYFWSSNQATQNANAATMTLVPNVTKIMEYTKADGFNVRCVLTETRKGAPSVSEVRVSDMTSSDLKVSAVITNAGGSRIVDRGFVWNDTGSMPVVGRDQTVRPAILTSPGSFDARVSGFEAYKTYHIWAFAKNEDSDIVLSKVSTFKYCPPITRRHVEGANGAARTVTITYDLAHSTLSGESACWITRNLGAVNAASGPNDATGAAAGWYWQFGNKQGYEYLSSRYPVAGWTNPIDLNSNLTALNDPCVLLLGGGWRLPTSAEYSRVAANWPSIQQAYNSELKVHAGGSLDGSTGVLETNSRGVGTAFWSSTSSATRNAWDIRINASPAVVMSIPKSYGLPVRCMLTTPEVTAPVIDGIKLSNFTSTSVNAVSDVVFNGGSAIVSRGFVWNNTGDPRLENKTGSMAHAVAGDGPFSLAITGLSEGIYHMRAYATNSDGVTGYGAVEKFRICAPSISVNHVAGVSGAPKSKMLTYNLVGTNLNDQLNCWITKNLGADVEAGSFNDANPAASGWYWQFNRLQGYDFDGVRTPVAPWMASVSETAHWAANTDPCRVMLGGTWRLPTAAEWTAANNLWNSKRGSDPALKYAYDSGLKLHTAGWLNGAGVAERGVQARYWSSNRAGEGFYVSYTESWAWHASTTTSSVSTWSRVLGSSVRCIQ